jgi:hypothetical protein
MGVAACEKENTTTLAQIGGLFSIFPVAVLIAANIGG